MAVNAENELERNHVGQRPSWDCAACGQSWPCANAKDMLLTEFRGCPSVLTIYMSAQLCEAVFDLTAHGTDPPTDLFDRFMSWVHLAATGTPAGDASARAWPPHPRDPGPHPHEPGPQAQKPSPQVQKPSPQPHEPSPQGQKPSPQAREPCRQPHEPNPQAQEPSPQKPSPQPHGPSPRLPEPGQPEVTSLRGPSSAGGTQATPPDRRPDSITKPSRTAPHAATHSPDLSPE